MTSMYLGGEIGAGYVHYRTEAQSLWQAHAHLEGVWLRPTDVTLYVHNALLSEPGRPIKDIELFKYLRFLQWLVRN